MTTGAKTSDSIKAVLIFLSGALLGSIATWFLWLGQLRPQADVAYVPVTQEATPPPLIPVQRPVPEGTVPSPASAPTTTPVDAAQPIALPPESTPVAPDTADGVLLSPPSAALPPLRPLALSIPVAGVTAAQLHDTFTDTRGTDRVHEAIDIPAPVGTPVLAVEDGHVEKLFDSKPGGLTVYQFDRAGELVFYYAHLDRYAPGLLEGQQLRQGDLVGYVGYTGNANPDSPHLHFAIFRLGPEKKWWKGTPINPYPLLRGQ